MSQTLQGALLSILPRTIGSDLVRVISTYVGVVCLRVVYCPGWMNGEERTLAVDEKTGDFYQSCRVFFGGSRGKPGSNVANGFLRCTLDGTTLLSEGQKGSGGGGRQQYFVWSLKDQKLLFGPTPMAVDGDFIARAENNTVLSYSDTDIQKSKMHHQLVTILSQHCRRHLQQPASDFAPTSIALSPLPSRKVYVTFRKLHCVVACFLESTVCGEVMQCWGTQGKGCGEFNEPCGIAVDGVGNVYVCDSLNHRVQVFTGAGKYLTQIGERGWNRGQLDLPYAAAFDRTRNILFVSEVNNRRVQLFLGSPARSP